MALSLLTLRPPHIPQQYEKKNKQKIAPTLPFFLTMFCLVWWFECVDFSLFLLRGEVFDVFFNQVS
jgi:hypothetical protein